jgi:hypothetical protein
MVGLEPESHEREASQDCLTGIYGTGDSLVPSGGCPDTATGMRKQKVKRRRRAAQLSPEDRARIRSRRTDEAAAKKRSQADEAAAKERADLERARAEDERAREARRRRAAGPIARGARACPNCEGYIDPETLLCAEAPQCDLWEDHTPRTSDGDQRQMSFKWGRFDRGCEACGKSAGHLEGLRAHHLSYRAPRGTEADEHFMLLCKNCHDALHERLKLLEKEQREGLGSTRGDGRATACGRSLDGGGSHLQHARAD